MKNVERLLNNRILRVRAEIDRLQRQLDQYGRCARLEERIRSRHPYVNRYHQIKIAGVENGSHRRECAGGGRSIFSCALSQAAQCLLWVCARKAVASGRWATPRHFHRWGGDGQIEEPGRCLIGLETPSHRSGAVDMNRNPFGGPARRKVELR